MPKVDTTKCRVRFCPYTPTSRADLDYHVDHVHRNTQDKFICLQCPSFGTQQLNNLNSHISAVHNPQRFACPVEGCKSTQASQRALKDHIAKKHHGLGFIECPVEGCTFKSQYQNSIDNHVTSVHSDNRAFVCPFDGCEYTAKRRDTLQTHMRRHTDERPYVCNADGCNKSFRFRQSLMQHTEHHQPTKPMLHCHICSTYKTNRPARLRQHVNEVHLDEKPHACEYEDCTFRSTRKAALRQHVNAVHEKTEMYTCSHETCDFATYWDFVLQKHLRVGHTDTGERVRNGQEFQFLRALKDHFDVQQPYAIRQEHLTHCRRKFIHVDAAIALPERDLLVLIECDEQQHKDTSIYDVRQELVRMQDATQGIRASGETAHVLWIRFNPDTYTVTTTAGEQGRQNDALTTRIARVVEFIQEFVPVDNDSEQDMTVAYMYYDVTDGVATVTQHEEYFDELKQCTITLV